MWWKGIGRLKVEVAPSQPAGIAYSPTAVFAASDTMAIGALYAAEKMNYRVPEDIAIIGFDDIPCRLLGSSAALLWRSTQLKWALSWQRHYLTGSRVNTTDLPRL